MSSHGGTRAVVAALAANGFIALCKLVGWALTGASSMLAEAIHSVADCGNQVMLLVGRKRSQREADTEHPFGYGRERYVFAFLVSVILFSVGGLFALYEAYHKLGDVRAGHPNELLSSRWWWVPVLILVAALVAESLSLRTAVREATPSRGAQTWMRFIKTAKAPELPVILLEDTAALCGLVFALFGVVMTLVTRNGLFDVIGTALIGLLLVAIAVVLAWETKSLLIGEAATPQAVHRIRAALTGSPGVVRVIHLKTLHLGPDEVMVAAKIGVEAETTAAEVAALIDTAERAVRTAEPMVTALYLEPDIYVPGHIPPPRPDQQTSTEGSR